MSWMVVLLNFTAQFAITFTPQFEKYRFIPFCILGLTLLLYVVGRGNKYNFTDKKKHTGTIMTVIFIVWIKWEFYWIAAVNAALYMLYLYATRKFEVIVSEDKITYPSFPKRRISWNELQNVIMKDGILTIDFKNNKLLQAETEGEDSFNEKKFNEFCSGQLKK